MIELLQTNPLIFIVIIAGLILALAFHEAAHAYAAHMLGDDTAKNEGRLTINPFAHLDILGTLSLIFFKFGWGKPVPVNPNNFKSPAFGNLMVAIAGPSMNLLIAVILAMVARFLPIESIAFSIIDAIVYINILLAFFNLLPIPPLDGSKILGLFMSQESYYELEKYGPFILIAFIFVVATTSLPIFDTFLGWVTSATNWLIGV